MNIELRYCGVQVESGTQVRRMETDYSARLALEPVGERGSGPLVGIRVVAYNTNPTEKWGRVMMEMDKRNAAELIRNLRLHFGFTDEELA